MMKRTIALVLTIVLCLSLVGIMAGCKSGKRLNKAQKVLGDDVVIDGSNLKYDSTYTIDMWLPDNTDIEMEGCYVDKLLEKTLNMNLKITEYESRDQYETLIAQQKVPQLTLANAKIFGPAYGPLGAYIDWNDYIDQMPNVKKWLKEDERFQQDLADYTEEDGSIYQLPLPQTGHADVYGFLYRKDIFDKHNLTFPTNQEELMTVLRFLKNEYKNSYPFVQRGLNGANLGGLTSLADLFDGEYTGFGTYNTLYRLDDDHKTYYLAQTSDNMRECLQWLHDLYEEGLLHPSCLTMDTAQWTEAFANNTSFVSFDKMDRIQMLTMGAIDANPGYVLTGAPGFKMGTNGDGTLGRLGTGFSFLVSGDLDAENMLKVLQYIDFLFSDRGIELTNWGEKGVSYEGDGDARDFKADFTYEGSGLGVAGLFGVKDFDVYCKSQEQHVIDAIKKCEKTHVEEDKGFRLTYTDVEQRTFDTYFQKTYDLCQARFQEFIGGTKNPETDWDAYVQEVNSSLPDSMMKIHNDALARYKEKHPDKFN